MVVFSIYTCFTCHDNSYVNHIPFNVCEVREKSLLKDLLNRFIDTGITFENQGFVKTIIRTVLRLFNLRDDWDVCCFDSKWLVTRTTGVSAIAYMSLGTSQLLVIFLIGGLCWLLVKWQIVLLSFFLRLNKRESLQKFLKYSYTETKQFRNKVSSSYQRDLCFQIQVHGIKENIERQ